MDEIKAQVARIDENVRLLREDMRPLVVTVHEHSRMLAIIKNDKRWTKNIFTTLIGLIGVMVGALAEFLRK